MKQPYKSSRSGQKKEKETGRIFVKQEILELLPQMEALLLDIDGVIVNVSNSFRFAICETTQFYCEKILGWKLRSPLINPVETELFKRAGGFNSDWDLVLAVLLLCIYKRVHHQVSTAIQIRQAEPTLEQFTAQIAREGSGLHTAEKLLLEDCHPGERREIMQQLNQRLIIQIFKEIYGGEDYCRTLYGFEPEYVKGEGLAHREEVILVNEKLPTSIQKLGIVTGRTLEEAQMVLERIGLLERLTPEYLVTNNDGVKKPDPQILRIVLDRMGVKLGIFVGDTLDDLNTVKSFNRTTRKRQIISCQVLTSPAGEDNQSLFLERGADIVAPDVNVFLDFLSTAMKT